MHLLIVTHGNDPCYQPPSVLGPYRTVAEAQVAAEDYRRRQGLPVEATPENNEAWTDLGWYFGIFEPVTVEQQLGGSS